MVEPGTRDEPARAPRGAGRRVLPGGTVTFVFTDIEGSTRLVKALRDRYAEVLAGHRRLVRAAIAAQGGHEVDTQGDAFFAAFASAKQAVLCALEIQRALAGQDWPGGAQVRVRIGVHTGQAVPAGDGYTGLAVHRAARICAAARGGQVLVSQPVRDLIEDEEEGEGLGFVLIDAGEVRLKDLDRPVRLFELAAPGLDPGPPRADWMTAAGSAAGGMHGFPAALTSFIGRAGPVREVAGLLERRRLVTVTGPGGAGKTRLAGEVARRVAGRFADGAWLAELAPVADPTQVASVVAAALGVREQPGVPAGEALARVLAQRQLLLVLDNCEHVIAAAAELCAGLLAACDDVRILATSREALQVGGEARYRLAPLALPDLDDLAGAAQVEAVALFADRARSADAHFVLDGQTGPAVARLVARLDGMPLAIELAAARVEALGVTQLLDRLDDRFALLAGGERAAPSRQRSLAATLDWSYQLLDDHERRVFCQLSVFPAGFTLEAAEAVAGTGAEPAVLHLVDCSLLVPPRAGPDGRPRYLMLETLRAYGNRRLAEAGEQDGAAAALARWALAVAGEAAAGLETGTGELSAARRLDAEDATMRQVLTWAIDHDPGAAARLAAALAPWWRLRGRLAGEYPRLREAAGRAEAGSDGWCAAQWWLGWTAAYAGDRAAALGHFTAVRDAAGNLGPSRVLADALGGRSQTLAHLGRLAEAAEEGRRSLAMARELGYPGGQLLALFGLISAAYYAGDLDTALELSRQAGQVPGDLPGLLARDRSSVLMWVLTEARDLAAAEEIGAAGLAQARDAGDLKNLTAMLAQMADLDARAGRVEDAAAQLRQALQITVRTGYWSELDNVLWYCGFLCAATGRHAEAVTVWAAMAALFNEDLSLLAHGNLWSGQGAMTAGASSETADGMSGGKIGQIVELIDAEPPIGAAPWVPRLREALRQALQALGPARIRAAEERGAAMSHATAAEYVLLLTAPAQSAAPGPRLAPLSARERELVTLVARGRTDAQIAAQLSVSIGTVRSRLDRIRDNTGCRRRADLTRLALQAGLV
jgi:predicted ATPase/class 3 adenylate cyclase/DNA-binding CsgD family transcriptional regulator